jgi:DNA-binding MarR family transcriptional regulator
MRSGNKRSRLRKAVSDLPAKKTRRSKAPSTDATRLNTLATSMGYIVADVRRSILRVLQAHMAAHNIPASFWPFLRALWLEDGISQRELGRRAGILDAAAGSVVRNLEENGYVVRERSADDQRKILVRLAPLGRALESTLFPTITNATDVALYGFADSEAQELIQFLLRMQKNLSQDR